MRKLLVMAILFVAACTQQPPTQGDPYNITLRLRGTLTPNQQAAFNSAAAKWSQVVTAGFPNQVVSVAENECGNGVIAFDGAVDDVLIDVRVEPIDGVGGILASAGPCIFRNSNNLTVFGTMRFDSADIDSLDPNTIFHEMGHVLGIGTLWNFPPTGAGARSLLQGEGSNNPRYVGARGVAEWQALGGTGNVPVENCLDGSNTPIPGCGVGTRDGHWREAIFGTEVMTGYLDKGVPNPLSRVTIGSMADLGYTVNYAAAEPYTLPQAPGIQNFATKQQLKVILTMPVRGVGP